MAIKKARKYPRHIEDELATDLVEREYALFGQYARPDGETRAMLDKALGDLKLTDILYQMREEGL